MVEASGSVTQEQKDSEGNLTTTHFAYHSCEHVPQGSHDSVSVGELGPTINNLKGSAPKTEESSHKLYRQDIDSIIKYIESDTPLPKKGEKKPKQSSDEKQKESIPDGVSDETKDTDLKKKKKKRRKKKNNKLHDYDDEEDQPA